MHESSELLDDGTSTDGHNTLDEYENQTRV